MSSNTIVRVAATIVAESTTHVAVICALVLLTLLVAFAFDLRTRSVRRLTRLETALLLCLLVAPLAPFILLVRDFRAEPEFVNSCGRVSDVLATVWGPDETGIYGTISRHQELAVVSWLAFLGVPWTIKALWALGASRARATSSFRWNFIVGFACVFSTGVLIICGARLLRDGPAFKSSFDAAGVLTLPGMSSQQRLRVVKEAARPDGPFLPVTLGPPLSSVLDRCGEGRGGLYEPGVARCRGEVDQEWRWTLHTPGMYFLLKNDPAVIKPTGNGILLHHIQSPNNAARIDSRLPRLHFEDPHFAPGRKNGDFVILDGSLPSIRTAVLVGWRGPYFGLVSCPRELWSLSSLRGTSLTRLFKWSAAGCICAAVSLLGAYLLERRGWRHEWLAGAKLTSAWILLAIGSLLTGRFLAFL